MSEKVLSRVRKMLVLANDAAATEGERDNALRMAYATLAKHNLSIADVGDGRAADEKRDRVNAQMSVYPWARDIAHAIAGLFFCSYYFSRGTGKSANHYFVGRESNAVTACEMSKYVVSSVFKELRQRYGSETSPEARSFAVGVATAVLRRARQLREAAQADNAKAAPGTALVLVDVYESEKAANALWLSQNVRGLKTAANRTKLTVTGAAYAAGKDYGGKVSLNAQVGASQSKPRTALK